MRAPSDSLTILHELDSRKIYIVGGFVERDNNEESPRERDPNCKQNSITFPWNVCVIFKFSLGFFFPFF